MRALVSDDPPRVIVRLDANLLTTWCAQLHDVREIELERLKGTRWRIGDCPLCDRRYESEIIGRGYVTPD